MAINVARFASAAGPCWGIVRGTAVVPLSGDYPTTSALIERCACGWPAAQGEPIALNDIELLSPVTTPCRIFCQGANYRQHMIESALDPDAKTFDMFFTKSDASVAPPVGTVQRPAHVALLDYEIELALVFRRAIQSPVTVTREALKDYVFAAAIGNDISARDVQLPQMQFFKGKSYRGFCPLGPWLTVLEPDEFAFLDDLHLQLVVNGTVRQSDTTANLVFKPWETISELSTFANVSPGDVLLTGTPSGCALHVPPPTVRRFLQLLPERTFWQLFVTSQSRRLAYLQPGDRMTATIRSADGRLNLGQQTTTIA